MSKSTNILSHPNYKNEVAHLEGTISEMKNKILIPVSPTLLAGFKGSNDSIDRGKPV